MSYVHLYDSRGDRINGDKIFLIKTKGSILEGGLPRLGLNDMVGQVFFSYYNLGPVSLGHDDGRDKLKDNGIVSVLKLICFLVRMTKEESL